MKKEALDIGRILQLEGLFDARDVTDIHYKMIPAHTFTFKVPLDGDFSDIKCKLHMIEKALVGKFIATDEHWLGSHDLRRCFFGKCTGVSIVSHGQNPNRKIQINCDIGNSTYMSTFVWGRIDNSNVNNLRHFVVYDTEEDFTADRLMFELFLERFRSTEHSFIISERDLGIY